MNLKKEIELFRFNLTFQIIKRITCGLLIPLICSFGVLIFDGLPRFFLLASPFVDTSSFFVLATTTVFGVGVGVDSPAFAGRPRARFGVSDLIGVAFVEPADFGGRPRPFFPPAFVDDDDDGLFPFSSKSNFYY